MTSARFLVLPGWQDSGPDHWQSLWAARPGFQRVQQDDWWWPRRGDWMANLENQLLAEPTPAVLVAHSLGCHLVARWAGHTQHADRVAAALLVAPPDIERADLPPQVQAWAPIQGRLLPFASTVVASDNDPYAALARAQAMAQAWGSASVTVRHGGHLNSDSGLADWPGGWQLLQALCAQAGVGGPD